MTNYSWVSGILDTEADAPTSIPYLAGAIF